MNTHPPERRDGAVNLAVNDIRVHAGFRVVTEDLLAGGPIELEFFAESWGSTALQLAVSGDRMTQRPGQFRFAALFEGTQLKDPMARMPVLGGPVGVVQVTPERAWCQTLILNQFVRLEDTIGQLEHGAAGRLDLACHRPLVPAATEAEALSTDGARIVAVDLAVALRRDDAALTALATGLFGEVMQNPAASRERPLALLLAMRSGARDQIDALARHPETAVAERAQRVLATLC
ncbi:hypothetical protein [Paraburkholderia sp. GAS42]|jgi:hypothetical protein|uniref:hypothetical protein n=1 Tax=Paraburkholderia sp. GAS42 TaxID=3035135 RepID=UPI003D1EEE48